MLSLSQILFTALVAVVVWQGAKFFGRKSANQARQQANRQNNTGTQQRQSVTQDMVKCPHCGVYHVEGDGHRCDS